MFQLPSKAAARFAFLGASLLGGSLMLGACGDDDDGIVPAISRGGNANAKGGATSNGHAGGGAGGAGGAREPVGGEPATSGGSSSGGSTSGGNAGAGGAPATDPNQGAAGAG